MTNGFDTTKVYATLDSRIGWKQTSLSGEPVLSEENKKSDSGRYFNDGSFHPLVTLKNIKETIEDSDISDDDFNSELQSMKRSAIISCLNAVFSKSLLTDDTLLFDISDEQTTPIENSGRFVGVRLSVSPGHALRVNSITLLADGEATFNIYLFHSSKPAPIWSQEVTTSAGENKITTPLSDLLCNYINDSVYSGGYFFLGYFQDDLGGVKMLSQNVCRKNAKCFGYSFVESVANGNSFDRKNISITSTPFLNVHISVFKDETERIIGNAHLFDNAIGLTVAHNVSKAVIYSTRSNKDQRILQTDMDKMGLQYELNGSIPVSDIPKSYGLQSKINSELKKVAESFYPIAKPQIMSLC